jgi:LemA protein
MIWILIIIAVLLVLCVGLFNQLVRRRTSVKEAWSGIQVQLKRRYDLIPNLVETVKGYRQHERDVLEQVTLARTRCLDAQGVKAQASAEQGLSQALKSLFAVSENYPDLKANVNFVELQKQLADVEEQLQMARRYYNGTVRDYNIAVQSFPGMLIAGLFSFSSAEFFEGAPEEAQTPRVQF